MSNFESNEKGSAQLRLEEHEKENDLRMERSLSQKNKNFVLDGVRNTSKLRDYNALKDRHLQGFFYSRGIRRHLLHIGLITKDGYIIEDKRPKFQENYQIMPVDDNVYEDKAKEIAKKNEKKQKKEAQQEEKRSKSSKNANYNKYFSNNKPKNFEKLPIINSKKEENMKNSEIMKTNEKNKEILKKKLSSPELNKNLKNLPNDANKGNNLSKNESTPFGNQIKPLTKQDLNKWFEQCINKLERDPDVASMQKEKLNKTKENLIKIGNTKGIE